MQKKIILATFNKSKLLEFIQIAKTNNVFIEFEPISPNIGYIPEIGKNYLENALIKANMAYKYYRSPVLSDDSGLELINFNNIPGVYSARYAGINATEQENRNKLKNFLLDNNLTSTPARYRCFLVYKSMLDQYKFFEAIWDGKITINNVESEGFGYDPMFIPIGCKKTITQIDQKYKNTFSHRARALAQFFNYVKEENKCYQT
ncbi:MAG: non-canonical purine NTP pyrophosphatase [Candidatus Dasytiphilus stammeri]